jgi:hypothetical protein
MRKKNKTANIIKAAVGLFAYVSENPGKAQVKRVDTILELLAAIQTEKRFEEKAQLLEHLQEAFTRYRWIRGILFTNDGPHEYVTSARQQTDDDEWEYGAADILLTIAEYHPDRLSKIRRCEVCRRWMLTAKSDHRFCSGKCRQYNYDNDPKQQELHRANMRRLYQVEKERRVSAKKAIGFKKARTNG